MKSSDCKSKGRNPYMATLKPIANTSKKEWKRKTKMIPKDPILNDLILSDGTSNLNNRANNLNKRKKCILHGQILNNLILNDQILKDEIPEDSILNDGIQFFKKMTEKENSSYS